MPKEIAKIIYYYFQMEDDTVYLIEYFIDLNSFHSLSEQEMGNTFYRTKEKLEKEGAKKEGDKYSVPLSGMEKEAWGDNLQWIVVPME